MGISASKRVSNTLTNSTELNAACDSVYSDCLDLTQHAFPGLLPYQLTTAANLLYAKLTSGDHNRHSLIAKWLRSPPTRSQIDTATQHILITRRRSEHVNGEESELVVIELEEFKGFAIELFTLAVVDNAAKAVRSRIPIGIGGILGLGIVTRSGKDLIGTAIGAYALCVCTSVYLGLSS